MTETIIKPPRLGKAIFSYNGSLFLQLVSLLEECSYLRGGCHCCPHLKPCVIWWDTHVVEYCTMYTLRQERPEDFRVRFQRIRWGWYNGSGYYGGAWI